MNTADVKNAKKKRMWLKSRIESTVERLKSMDWITLPVIFPARPQIPSANTLLKRRSSESRLEMMISLVGSKKENFDA